MLKKIEYRPSDDEFPIYVKRLYESLSVRLDAVVLEALDDILNSVYRIGYIDGLKDIFEIQREI